MPMKPLASTRFAALAAVALAACNQQPAGSRQSPDPVAVPAVSAPAPVIAAPAQVGTANLPGDHTTTRHYKIAIGLPSLSPGQEPLADAMRTTADNAKREFLQSLPDPQQMPELADRQFELLLDFKVAAETPAFTSVRETGMQDSGGAHPIPVEAAFVFDRKAGRLIALGDLFNQPDAAREALAGFVRDKLLKQLSAGAPRPGEGSPEAIREWKSNMLQMLDDGTQPTTVNYSVFVVRAGAPATAPSPGLTLIFSPYQVAPYASGTQTVEVPASVFAKYLKAGYRGAFAD
jgi:hypothetical protein